MAAGSATGGPRASRVARVLDGPRRILLVGVVAVAVAAGSVAGVAAVVSLRADATPQVIRGWPAAVGHWDATADWMDHGCPSGEGKRTYVDGRRHPAIDLGAKAGTAVKVIDDGRILKIDRNNTYWDARDARGQAVGEDLVAIYVQHKTASGRFFVAEYAHVRTAPGITVGMTVLQGTVIATVGDYGPLGSEHGDHLHFAIAAQNAVPGRPGVGVINCSDDEKASKYQSPAAFLNANKPAKERFWDGWLVQWDGDPAAQKNAWFVSDGKRYWVPTAEEWYCHIHKGHEVAVLPHWRLDALTDQQGKHTTCLGGGGASGGQHSHAIPLPDTVPLPDPMLPRPSYDVPERMETIPTPTPDTAAPGKSASPTTGPGDTPPPETTATPTTTQPPATTTTRPPATTTTTTAAPRPRTYPAQQARNGANTFTNYVNASGQGPRIEPRTTVEVSCKVRPAQTIASAQPDGYWYRIASAPWNNQYYAVANTFWNGDVEGRPPYTHNVDHNIPDC